MYQLPSFPVPYVFYISISFFEEYGLIRPTRAVYGAAFVPATWQREMEKVLAGIPNVINFYDDILIHARDSLQMLKVLTTVLQRFRDVGLKLNRAKCRFFENRIDFLGHTIDETGIHTSQEYVKALLMSPAPTDPKTAESFLGAHRARLVARGFSQHYGIILKLFPQ